VSGVKNVKKMVSGVRSNNLGIEEFRDSGIKNKD
jgi:hypothetical protein